MQRVWDRLVLQEEPPAGGDLPQAAVLAPLFVDAGGEMRLVLTKRPYTMPTHAGHLAFPGGRPDPGDHGPVDTALREAHEEVGIDPKEVEVLGYLPEIHTVSYSLMVVPVVGRLPDGDPHLVPDPREVDKILLPAVADLADESGWRHEIWRERRVWFFPIDGDILWGATAWMTRTMLGLPT